MNDGPLVIRALQSILGLYGATYLATAIFSPRWFLDTVAINHVQRRRRRRDRLDGEPWWMWPWALATMLAVGVVVYAAVDAIVSVIPYDWGGHNEDGEWESTRYFIQVTAGFFGAMALTMRLEKNAEVLVWGPHERTARATVIRAARSANGMTPDIRNSIAATAERDLEPDPLNYRGYELDYVRDLSQSVGAGIRG